MKIIVINLKGAISVHIKTPLQYIFNFIVKVLNDFLENLQMVLL